MSLTDDTRAAHAAASEEILVTIVAGDDALLWSREALNQSAWDRLWAACPWSTAFQSRAFFDIWARNYREVWSPLLVIGRRADGSLAGIMPLAENRDAIVGAGAHQAEYQGPISSEGDALAFFRAALAALAKHAPRHELRLRYLPWNVPSSVVEWLGRYDRALSVPCVTWHMLADGTAVDSAMKKAGNKSKLNRLRRVGQVEFRRLTPELLEADFDRIVAMYDFRQGALHDVCPFADDRRKLRFHLDWLRNAPHQLHATGLYVDGQLISAVLLAWSKDEAHLAISAHSPVHAVFSPSKLNLYFAARSLSEEGGRALDLTPGDDPWKARFGSQARTVWDVKVFASPWTARAERSQRTVKHVARRLLSYLGLSADDFKGWIRRLDGALRLRRAKAARSVSQYLFDIGRRFPREERTAAVSVNSLQNLLSLSGAFPRDERSTFLAEALGRIESGDQCFVAFDRTRTAYCLGWLRTQEKAKVATFCGFRLSAPAHIGTAVSCLSAMVDAADDGTSCAALLHFQRDQQVLLTAATIVASNRSDVFASDTFSDLSRKVINQ